MTDDGDRGDDNVIHFDPHDRQPKVRNRQANPLALRREINSHALTKGMVAFDSFAHKVMLMQPVPRPGLIAPKEWTPREWGDSDDTALTEHLNARGFTKVGRAMVRDVIVLDAQIHPYHPVQNYLSGLRWDGVGRLSNFFIDFCGAVVDGNEESSPEDTTKYIQAVTRAMFISAVARVFKPGCKCDSMVIIEGGQGSLKSSLLRLLAVRDEWFSDSLPHNLSSRDARQHLMGIWIVEMGEIAQFKKSEVEAVKDFLSCQIDRFRPPYGRNDIIAKRQCIMIGSTNSEQYFHDVTGNRRFWPVRVGTIRLGDIRPIVDQLWAEATAAYHNGEKWWLGRTVETIAEKQQDSRLERDPWYEPIGYYTDSKRLGGWFTTGDVLSHLDIPVARRERTHEMRVGACLKLLGCERAKRWDAHEGKTRWMYRATENTPHKNTENKGPLI